MVGQGNRDGDVGLDLLIAALFGPDLEGKMDIFQTDPLDLDSPFVFHVLDIDHGGSAFQGIMFHLRFSAKDRNVLPQEIFFTEFNLLFQFEEAERNMVRRFNLAGPIKFIGDVPIPYNK